MKGLLECPCCGVAGMQPVLVMALTDLEKAWGSELMITSGYRCEKRNAEVGGAPKSYHMTGLAVDLAKPKEFLKLLELAKGIGFTGFGVGSTFVHLDMRPGKVTCWRYTDKGKTVPAVLFV